MNKRRLIGFGVILLVLLVAVWQGSGILLGARASQHTGPAPTVVVWPAMVKLHSGTNVVIMGSGFEAGQEMYVLLPSGDGSVTNVIESLKPAPDTGGGIMADDRGNFAYLFTFGRLERIGLEGVVDITITDLSYNTLASTSVAVADPDGRSRLGIYPRKAPDYAKNPDDIRPAPWAAPFFEYPERP